MGARGPARVGEVPLQGPGVLGRAVGVLGPLDPGLVGRGLGLGGLLERAARERGRKLVIQRRFNVGVLEAMSDKKASTL